MKPMFPLVALIWAASAAAATPAELLSAYRTEAAGQASGFQSSAQRGADFHVRQFGISAKLASCASCHTDQPEQAGRHVVTNKAIKPLAPSANAERFSDPAKVEKWFKRNCTEVVGRECSAAEKADYIDYVTRGR